MTEPTPERATRRARLLVALNATAGVDRAALCRLGSCDAWLEQLGKGSPGTSRPLSTSVLDPVRRNLRGFQEVAERETRRARRAGASILTRADPGYPAVLLDLPEPPPALYVRGSLLARRPAIAIVGSRAADEYGLETATTFARYLAAHGLVIVSGLARGIDSAAHRGALEAPGGETIAVLGCGIDVEYPRRSARLADRIARAGAVVSEFPAGTRPFKTNFPMRNRILAALGLGTLVVRAAARSGSLITARLALELGRDVYALPGNIFDHRSIGPNSLIRDGALLVQHPREMIESLPSRVRELLTLADAEPPTAREAAAADLERHLKDVLRRLPHGESRTAEEIAGGSGRPVAAVLSALLELELAGWVKRCPGPKFCRRGDPW